MALRVAHNSATVIKQPLRSHHNMGAPEGPSDSGEQVRNGNGGAIACLLPSSGSVAGHFGLTGLLGWGRRSIQLNQHGGVSVTPTNYTHIPCLAHFRWCLKETPPNTPLEPAASSLWLHGTSWDRDVFTFYFLLCRQQRFVPIHHISPLFALYVAFDSL